MAKKQRIDIIIALNLLFISIVLLVLPLFNIHNLNIIIPIVFSLYSIINLIQYLLTKEYSDREGLYTFFASIIALIESLIFDISNSYKLLALTIMTWVTIMSLIKLKKADYYHDRKKIIWKLRTFTLLIFILSGLLTCINFSYSETTRLIIIGYFFFIHAILEIIDPITNILINTKE